jgi:hypothetical protein
MRARSPVLVASWRRLNAALLLVIRGRQDSAARCDIAGSGRVYEKTVRPR